MLFQLHNSVVFISCLMYKVQENVLEKIRRMWKKLHLVWGVHYPVWPARRAAWKRCCYEPGVNVGLTCSGVSTSKQWVQNVWLPLRELWRRLDESCHCMLHMEKGRQMESTGSWPYALYSTLGLSAGTNSNNESHPEMIVLFSACIVFTCLSSDIGLAHHSHILKLCIDFKNTH